MSVNKKASGGGSYYNLKKKLQNNVWNKSCTIRFEMCIRTVNGENFE